MNEPPGQSPETQVTPDIVDTLVKTTRKRQRLTGGQILRETRPGFLELAVSAQSYAEELLEDAQRRYHPPIACSEGCDYCCHIAVNVSVPEVLVILDYIDRHFSESEKEALGERVRDRRRALLSLSGQERKLTNVRCPLLGEDGACSVYPRRPLSCRGFNSTDVEACRQRYERPDLDLSNPAFGYNLYATRGIAQGLKSALEDAEFEPVELDLIKALHLFWDDADRVVKKWRKKGAKAIKSARRFDT